jgi:hypothetical protein
MQHLDFIVWMLLYPLVCTADEAIRAKWCEKREYSDNVRGMAAFIMFLFYILIGAELW